MGDTARTSGRYPVTRTLHGFNDWVEFAKALAWVSGVIGAIFITTLFYVLDPRYMQKTDGDQISCQILTAEISQLETQILLINSRLQTAVDGERNQLENERGILTLKLVQKRREAAQRGGCHLEASAV